MRNEPDGPQGQARGCADTLTERFDDKRKERTDRKRDEGEFPVQIEQIRNQCQGSERFPDDGDQHAGGGFGNLANVINQA